MKNFSNSNVTVENRFTKEEMKVPTKVLSRGLRRPSRTDKIDLIDILDYILISNFEGAEKLVEHPKTLGRWKSYVDPRLSNLSISRRFDISARGTNLIAFYSSEPMVGVDMWNIKGLPRDDAMILTLWFNSTLNLTSLLVHRTETRERG